MIGVILGATDEATGIFRPAAGVLDGDGDFPERCSGFLDGGRLLLGAARQIIGRRADLVKSLANFTVLRTLPELFLIGL
ncbi:hypothetical protein ABID21_000057 [Pseudorhizobium tarimense]|uniref:Uncharacterized protein n=1 Tax=Pseudorhizobium tarimense TaxID=1079109 RepID=A0ABV2H0B0_9HYPH